LSIKQTILHGRRGVDSSLKGRKSKYFVLLIDMGFRHEIKVLRQDYQPLTKSVYEKAMLNR